MLPAQLTGAIIVETANTIRALSAADIMQLQLEAIQMRFNSATIAYMDTTLPNTRLQTIKLIEAMIALWFAAKDYDKVLSRLILDDLLHM